MKTKECKNGLWYQINYSLIIISKYSNSKVLILINVLCTSMTYQNFVLSALLQMSLIQNHVKQEKQINYNVVKLIEHTIISTLICLR